MFGQSSDTISFGQAFAFGVKHQFAMIKVWCFNSQAFVDQDLAGGGLQQVLTTHDLRYSHRNVVSHHRQFVGRKTILSPNQEVSEDLTCNERLRPAASILEREGSLVRHTETPIRRPGRNRIASRPRRRSQLRWENGVVCMGGAQSISNVFARTRTWVNVTAGMQFLPSGEIVVHSLALDVGSKGTTHVGSLLPTQSETAQVLHCSFKVFRSAT